MTNLILFGQCDPPTINDFTPKTGFIGSTVEINGSNFETVDIDDNIVYFGAAKAEVVSATFGTLVVTVPVGANAELLSVMNACNLLAFSQVPFNPLFCPSPLEATTFENVAFDLPVTYGPYNMAAADLDLDGKLDLITPDINSGISIATNMSTPGNLSFGAINIPYSHTTRSIAMADFDGDGKKDYLLTTTLIPNASTGPGNFDRGPIFTHNVGAYQITAGDVNGDGKVDIIGSTFGGQLTIKLNTTTGPGNFSFDVTTHTIPGAFGALHGMNSVDLDGDGKMDVIASSRGADVFVAWRNITPVGATVPVYEAPESWPALGDIYRSSIADFDKDGLMDVAGVNFISATTSILENISVPGDINFNTAILEDSPPANYRIVVGDVDADGYPDMVTKSQFSNTFSVYINTSSTGVFGFAPRTDYTSSAEAEVSGMAISDFDGDFAPDIATGGIESNSIRFHANTSAALDTEPPIASCKNFTLALSPLGEATLTPDDIDDGSTDACGINTYEISQTEFTCADVGQVDVILTVTDFEDQSSTCTATVTITEAEVVVTGQTTVCEGETVPLTSTPADTWQWKRDGVNIPGEIAQTYIASESGDYSVAVTNVNGCDGESPAVTLTVNANPIVEISPDPAYLCNGEITLIASTSSTYQWKQNGVDIPGATLNTYVVSVTDDYSVEVVDVFGCNALSDPVTVSVSEAPTASCNDITINLDSNGDYTIAQADIDAIAIGSSDNCPDFTYALVNGETTYDCDDVGASFIVILRVTDTDSNFAECDASVFVEDSGSSCNAPPEAICQNIMVSADNNCMVSVMESDIDNGSTDPDGDDLDISIDNGGPFGVGVHDVELTVSDGENTDVCIATVTVVDDTPPMVASLPDIEESCEVILVAPTANDNCAGTITATTTDPTSYYTSGNHVVTWTFDDGNGNSINVDQNVSVQDYLGIDSQDEWLESFTLTNVNNVSGNDGGYGDYTAQTVYLTINDWHEATFVPGYSGSESYSYFRIYIDYNHNGILEHAGERAAQGNAIGTEITTFDIPPNALPGPTLMRVTMGATGYQRPCEDYFEGEVEDYTVVLNYCDQITDAGSITSPGTICGTNDNPGEITSMMDAQGGSGGIEYVWLKNESYCDMPDVLESNGWKIVGANTSTYDPPPTMTSISYCRAARNFGCQDYLYSNVVHVEYSPACVPDCPAAGSDSQKWIKRFKLGNIVKNSGNDGGYANYTNVVGSADPGQKLTYQLRPAGTSGTAYWRVWADWNQDGYFEGNCELIIETSGTNTRNGQLYIPDNPMLGTTKIRAAMKVGSYPDPCETFATGEVEDYSITISAAAFAETEEEEEYAFNSMLPHEMSIRSYEDGIINNGFSFRPNPASDRINIELNESVIDGEFSIFNQYGKVVFQKTNMGDSKFLEVNVKDNNLLPGLYFIRLSSKNYKSVQKLIVI